MKLSGKFKVEEIKKKTKAIFFKDLNVGDEFTLVYSLNGGYHSAPYIRIVQDGKVVHGNNASQLQSNLENFEIKEVI